MPDEVAPRKPRRWPGRAIAILVLLMLVGHISNVVGLKECERDLLRRFTGTMKSPLFFTIEGKPIHLQSDVDYGILISRLNQIGYPYKCLTPAEYEADPFPHCKMGSAVPVCPFIVAIDFVSMVSRIGGAGGRIYMLNFFGYNLIVYGEKDWGV